MKAWEYFWTGWVVVTISVSWVAAVICIFGGAIDLHHLIKDLKAMPQESEAEDAMPGEGGQGQ